MEQKKHSRILPISPHPRPTSPTLFSWLGDNHAITLFATEIQLQDFRLESTSTFTNIGNFAKEWRVGKLFFPRTQL